MKESLNEAKERTIEAKSFNDLKPLNNNEQITLQETLGLYQLRNAYHQAIIYKIQLDNEEIAKIKQMLETGSVLYLEWLKCASDQPRKAYQEGQLGDFKKALGRDQRFYIRFREDCLSLFPPERTAFGEYFRKIAVGPMREQYEVSRRFDRAYKDFPRRTATGNAKSVATQVENLITLYQKLVYNKQLPFDSDEAVSIRKAISEGLYVVSRWLQEFTTRQSWYHQFDVEELTTKRDDLENEFDEVKLQSIIGVKDIPQDEPYDGRQPMLLIHKRLNI